MAQSFAVLAKDQSSHPSTHVRKPPAGTLMHTHTHHTQIKIKAEKEKKSEIKIKAFLKD